MVCRLISLAYVEILNKICEPTIIYEHVCHMNRGYDLLKSRCMYCMCEFNTVGEAVSLY